jgi:hypothetical protein
LSKEKASFGKYERRCDDLAAAFFFARMAQMLPKTLVEKPKMG